MRKYISQVSKHCFFFFWGLCFFLLLTSLKYIKKNIPNVKNTVQSSFVFIYEVCIFYFLCTGTVQTVNTTRKNETELSYFFLSQGVESVLPLLSQYIFFIYKYLYFYFRTDCEHCCRLWSKDHWCIMPLQCKCRQNKAQCPFQSLHCFCGGLLKNEKNKQTNKARTWPLLSLALVKSLRCPK